MGRKPRHGGRLLRELREALGLSAADVCRAAGVTSSELSLWETEQRAVPRTDRVQHGLSEALRVSRGQLYGYLTGELDLSEVLPREKSQLEQAVASDSPNRWCAAAVDLARELEPEAESWTLANWVRCLDECEEQIREARSKVRTRYELIMQGGIIDDDAED